LPPVAALLDTETVLVDDAAALVEDSALEEASAFEGPTSEPPPPCAALELTVAAPPAPTLEAEGGFPYSGEVGPLVDSESPRPSAPSPTRNAHATMKIKPTGDQLRTTCALDMQPPIARRNKNRPAGLF
jgi:hypothetical protein